MTKPRHFSTSHEVSSHQPLSDEYIATAVRDARRFQGQWCGNCHGRGFLWDGAPVFWITSGCPIHSPKATAK